jgi:hypothetical protein
MKTVRSTFWENDHLRVLEVATTIRSSTASPQYEKEKTIENVTKPIRSGMMARGTELTCGGRWAVMRGSFLVNNLGQGIKIIKSS